MSSSTSRFPRSSTPPEKSYFEQQREIILGEIAIVGNEFSSVEALWSQFENVMAKDPSTESPPEEDIQHQQHSSSKREEHEGEETIVDDDTRV
ncbi:hypothetical protein BTUL_0137g00250 [Botrytis tulipae]|uniref:DASH complex subunit DAD1 n=1 Tax=Botrytis tulipae TaxID=87230 RepID=A0A4Z1EII5_9HELO|nr:hypothetical protein BTUL_0137g00250 [Botrytis tulipae]